MSKLILLRHAQASFGAAKYDALSELGFRQAGKVGEFWKARGTRFDRVWIGPRDRHRLSAKSALAPCGQDWQGAAEPALDEFAEGQQIMASVEKQRGAEGKGKAAALLYAREIDRWAAGEIELEGVPPAADFRNRVAQWLRQATVGSAHSVLAVTSAGVISAVMCEVLKLPDAMLATFMRQIYNASLSQFVYSEGRSPTLVSFNVAGHLPEDWLTRL